MPALDAYGRPLRNLRLSVTDRCNLRCQYCMPERDYVWLPRRDILDFEEIGRLVDVFISLGVDRIRLTGGEPLVRHDLPKLIELISRKALSDIALTTNGVLLSAQAAALKRAGLHRATVSLDTLRPERFRDLTRSDELPAVLAGIEAAARENLSPLKIDTVVLRGVNDDELVALLDYGRRVGAEVRFIEYMDVGGATHWSRDKVVPRSEMLQRIGGELGPAEPLPAEGSAPAERFRLPDGTVFGIIASTTAPFCGSCDRSRLTADGLWYLCLYAGQGIDLRGPLRSGASPDALRDLIRGSWLRREDRGAEDRLAARDRSPLLPREALREDPHLEMHTRGG
jgi:cyclic pyranopterin phosphate synthase